MVASSLDLLEESLVKKIAVLDKIEEQTQRQKEVLQDPEKVDEAAFDETVNAKSELIDQILLLDEGFQSLFDKVKAEVEGNKDRYADQIKKDAGTDPGDYWKECINRS
jgi:archaellum component FlaC